MNFSVKTTQENRDLVKDLTRKFGFNHDNVVARIAFCYSLSKSGNLPLSPNTDSQGKEYPSHVLFGKHERNYVAMFCQRYGINSSDERLPKYVKLHLDHGLKLIADYFEENPTATPFDFLSETIERGLETMDGNSLLKAPSRSFVSGYSSKVSQDKIAVRIGKSSKDKREVYFSINDRTKNPNPHLAVVGGSGSGKTHLAFSVLQQIVEQSNRRVCFLYLDYKGIENIERALDQPFFKSTGAKLIDVPHKAFPVNPLGSVDLVNEQNKLLGMRKFRDIIVNYSNAGPRQAQFLLDGIREAFDHAPKGSHPTISDVQAAVQSLYGEEVNTLTAFLSDLSEFNIFDSGANVDSLINSNVYLSLSPSLPVELKFACIYLIINLVFDTFMKMDDVEISDGVSGLRYVLAIDEAHILFKDKKAQQLLDTILRMIRSKGVSVLLLSQGISEFVHANASLSDNCATTLVLDCKERTNLNLVKRFMGIGDKESSLLARSLGNLGMYQCISNSSELLRGEIIEMS